MVTSDTSLSWSVESEFWVKCNSHASINLGFVRLISRSNPWSFAESTISAFFIFFTAVSEGISFDSVDGVSVLLISLDVSEDVSEPLNNLAKKPFLLLSLLSLIIFA